MDITSAGFLYSVLRVSADSDAQCSSLRVSGSVLWVSKEAPAVVAAAASYSAPLLRLVCTSRRMRSVCL